MLIKSVVIIEITLIKIERKTKTIINLSKELENMSKVPEYSHQFYWPNIQKLRNINAND